MFAVDTNVFVHAVNSASPMHEPCNRLLTRWLSEPAPWSTTWSVLYEFARVATHPRVFPKPLSASHTRALVREIVKAPGMHVLTAGPEHADLFDSTLAEQRDLRGNLFHDLHIAVLMREHGIRRIVTRDTDFHRFKFLEVVDPAVME